MKTKKVNSKVNEKSEKIQPLVWTPAISVKNAHLDKQHQAIFAGFNRLIKNEESNDVGVVREIIHNMINYHKDHFSDEEDYMKKNGFPELVEHKKIHHAFTKFFLKYREDFERAYKAKKMDYDTLRKFIMKAKKYLADWFLNHVIIEDQKYVRYIEAKKSKGKIKEPNSKLKIEEHKRQILKQRGQAVKVLNMKERKKEISKEYVKTGIEGIDQLFENGIPAGNTVLVSGGAGSGKTIFCLQTLAYHAERGDKCFYMSFEENEERLKQHMKDFGWDSDSLIKSGKLKIERYSPFDISRSVEALLSKEKGELLIDIDPIIIPRGFNPKFIVIDSLTAVASVFSDKEDSYRIYIENLFRFFEKLGSTVFLITETKEVPEIYSYSGSEEFLADGVIVLYNIKKGDVRESAVEILKMRGAKHQKKIVAMQITDNGIVVYPEQEVFSEI